MYLAHYDSRFCCTSKFFCNLEYVVVSPFTLFNLSCQSVTCYYCIPKLVGVHVADARSTTRASPLVYYCPNSPRHDFQPAMSRKFVIMNHSLTLSFLSCHLVTAYYCISELVVEGDAGSTSWSCPEGSYCPNGTGHDLSFVKEIL